MKHTYDVDPKEMIALEEELIQLKRQHGIKEKSVWWKSLGDCIAKRLDKGHPAVSQKQYVKLALWCGWFCGAQRFYAGQTTTGMLYLLFCWTGIPFAMTLIDLMAVLPMKSDETGMIQL